MLILCKNNTISNIKKLRKLVNPFKEVWLNLKTTNCYAYALGLDVSVFDLDIEEYSLGFTTGYIPKYYTSEELLEYLIKDLDNLKIDFKFVNDYYKLGTKEWKMAIYGGQEYTTDSFDDFHFLKQTENGIWIHKQGYYEKPSNLDNKNKIILSPKNCNIDTEGIDYKYIKTLCLKRR